MARCIVKKYGYIEKSIRMFHEYLPRAFPPMETADFS
jgi:hypothetical protein